MAVEVVAMDKVRRRGLVSMAVLVLAGVVALALATWFLLWLFSDVLVLRGA